MPNSNPNTASKTAAKVLVRLSPQLKEELGDYAIKYHRSMNSEIVARLNHSITRENAENLARIQDAVNESPPQSDEEIFKEELSVFETRLIIFYRHLPNSKRKALLSLFTH